MSAYSESSQEEYSSPHVDSHYFLRHHEITSLKCKLCNEPGHISSQCYKTLYKCIYCGDSSHKYPKCPQSTCYICKTPGHTFKQCTLKQKCFQCNVGGHSEQACISRTKPCLDKDEKMLTCLNCHRQGHSNCAINDGKQGLSSSSCSLCGMRGHCADICPGNRKGKKVMLFREHVKEAMGDLPILDKKMNHKERRYWEKVERKAYKKLVKREKLKKGKKRRGKNNNSD